MSKLTPVPPLVQAATRMEAALEDFAKHVRLLEKEPLTSRRSLERASAAVAQVPGADERMTQAMGELGAALAALQARHGEHAARLVARGQEVVARTEAYTALSARLEGLGARGTELNAALQEVTASPEASRAEVAGRIEVALAKMGEVAEAVAALRRDCKAERFDDLEREVDRLEGQLSGAKTKLGKLQRDLVR